MVVVCAGDDFLFKTSWAYCASFQNSYGKKMSTVTTKKESATKQHMNVHATQDGLLQTVQVCMAKTYMNLFSKLVANSQMAAFSIQKISSVLEMNTAMVMVIVRRESATVILDGHLKTVQVHQTFYKYFLKIVKILAIKRLLWMTGYVGIFWIIRTFHITNFDSEGTKMSKFCPRTMLIL